MRDLKVIMMVSLCCPQVVPAKARRRFSRGTARETMNDMWGVKVKWGSNVTPKMRGLRSRGRGESSRDTSG